MFAAANMQFTAAKFCSCNSEIVASRPILLMAMIDSFILLGDEEIRVWIVGRGTMTAGYTTLASTDQTGRFGFFVLRWQIDWSGVSSLLTQWLTNWVFPLVGDLTEAASLFLAKWLADWNRPFLLLLLLIGWQIEIDPLFHAKWLANWDCSSVSC